MKRPPYYPYPDADPLWEYLPPTSWALASDKRQVLLEQSPILPGSIPAEFLEDALSDDELVHAYFHPRLIELGGNVRPHDPIDFLPARSVVLAAKNAYRSRLLQSHERGLAFLTTFLFPCGLFYLIHPVYGLRSELAPTLANARKQTGLMLEEPLRKLRQTDTTLGNIMTVLLGGRGGNRGAETDETLDANQIARLEAAVTSATCGLMALGLKAAAG